MTEVGTTISHQIKGAVSFSSMRTVAISAKLSAASLGFMPPACQVSAASSGAAARGAPEQDGRDVGEPGLRIHVVEPGRMREGG